MKCINVFGLLAAASTVVAQPHSRGHYHFHASERMHQIIEKDTIIDTVTVTVLQCWLGDRIIPEAECEQGIANGTLKWVSNSELQSAVSSSSTVASHATSTASSTSSSSATPTSSSVALSPQASSSSGSTGSNGSSGLNTPFPDGQIDCSRFPSDYGAMPVDWLGIGGWASVQQPGTYAAAGFDDILGVTKDQCENGNCCLEGAFCAYACPPGSQMFQWPSEQGASGQSIGGVLCKGGKLYKTNSNSQTLCGPGAEGVNVQIVNQLNKNVAVCRTIYPGSEGMVVPVDSQPGSTMPLTCPDGETYYQWEGKITSAQYYINMPGYAIEDACVWGSEGDDFGNWAPGVLGVGYSAGQAWVSIMPNWPTQMNAQIPYSITLTGDNAAEQCRYQNGQYCTGSNFESCSPKGCTVSPVLHFLT
jgi:hypothetical protein